MSTNFKLKEEKEITNTILKMSVSVSLASLGLVLSIFVILVPNVEFISITIFLITLLFGIYYGAMSAVSLSLIYEFIVTPIYGQLLLLFLFKLSCYILLVIVTGLIRKSLLTLSFWELGIFGSVYSFLFYVVTTIGGELILAREYLTLYYLLGKLVFGVVFATIHIVSNFVLFSLSKTIIKWIVSAFKARGIKPLMIITGLDTKNLEIIDKAGDKS